MSGDNQDEKLSQRLISIIYKLVLVICILVAALAIMPFIIDGSYKKKNKAANDQRATDEIAEVKDTTHYWTPADTSLIRDASLKSQVSYGAQLVAHTSSYF